MSTKSREVIWEAGSQARRSTPSMLVKWRRKRFVKLTGQRARASIPLDAIRRPWDTPTWKLEASLKCQSCRTPRSGAYDQVDRDAANLALQVGPPTGGLEPAFEVHGRAPLFGT